MDQWLRRHEWAVWALTLLASGSLGIALPRSLVLVYVLLAGIFGGLVGGELSYTDDEPSAIGKFPEFLRDRAS